MKTGRRTEGRSCVRTRGGLPGVAVRPRPCVRWRSPSADGAPQTGGTSRIN